MFCLGRVQSTHGTEGTAEKTGLEKSEIRKVLGIQVQEPKVSLTGIAAGVNVFQLRVFACAAPFSHFNLEGELDWPTSACHVARGE